MSLTIHIAQKLGYLWTLNCHSSWTNKAMGHIVVVCLEVLAGEGRCHSKSAAREPVYVAGNAALFC